MDTKEILSALWEFKTQSDIEDFIESELNKSITYLSQQGYKIDMQIGFDGKQSLNSIADMFAFQNFRDLHFIYWGLKGNWETYDHLEAIYFQKLKGVVESIYKAAKSI